MRNPLFSIKELVGVITTNYRLVDYNFLVPVILFKSPIFHDTF